ncbi:DUF2271 domain-containing protein [Sphingobium phenoxybenzoativorans]|uniref:DUF2271 domain-containing protein n=1 Tax=Sphingobium phenoxybenzoativorans TaxID=1592790 RepID=UPI0008727D0A|nr:DUF2271 domain-containing protein [Sphingobium phenoxybenzoativorans]
MQIRHSLILTGIAAVGAGAAPSALAETLDLTVTLPRMTVAEYHPPYVAIWLEKEGSPARTLSVWYDVDKPKNAGTKWLRDIRLWWRVSGRSMQFPADGVSGATRGPGTHKVSIPAGKLGNGAYTLVIEASREAGGREAVRVPFTVSGGKGSGKAAGTSELGAVALTVKP